MKKYLIEYIINGSPWGESLLWCNRKGYIDTIIISTEIMFNNWKKGRLRRLNLTELFEIIINLIKTNSFNTSSYCNDIPY